jgi:hypothetical protein
MAISDDRHYGLQHIMAIASKWERLFDLFLGHLQVYFPLCLEFIFIFHLATRPYIAKKKNIGVNFMS